jgi:uncharacterized membrane protein (UPF0127 family)
VRCALLLIAFLGCSSGPKNDEGATVPPQSQSQPPAAASTPAPAMPKVFLTSPGGELPISVEIVSTPAAIERGLMFRSHLPPEQGMLFLMDQQKVWSFWMHNTLIPLDIIFISNDMTIAGIAENAEPRTDDLRQVASPSSFVLEVNGGYCAAHKIAAGAKVRFDGVPPRG